MYLYYTPVILCLFSFVLSLKNCREFNLLFSISVLIIFSLFCGLRFFSEADYWSYYAIYENVPSLDNFIRYGSSGVHGEFLFLLFLSTFKYYELSFFIPVLIISIVSLSTKLYFFSRFSKYYFIGFSIYLCIHFVTIEFIQIRWAYSTGLICIAFYFFSLNKIKSAIGFIFLASMFHYFSLIFIFILFLSRYGTVKKYFVLFILSAGFFAVSHLFLNSFSYKFNNTSLFVVNRLILYVNDANEQTPIGLLSFGRVCLYVCILYFFFKYLQNSALLLFNEGLMIKATLITLSLSLLFSIVPIFYYRLMVVGDLLALALIFLLIEKNKSKIIFLLITFILVSLYSLWAYQTVINYTNSGLLWSYQSWLKYLY